jgi:hypothetical protein
MKSQDFKILMETVYPDKKHRRHMCKIIRLILTGQEHGPDLYSIMEVYGEEKCNNIILDFLKSNEIYIDVVV